MKKWAIMFILMLIIIQSASAQDAWIFCQPDSYVYARAGASKATPAIGRLELGDEIRTDGKTRGGFLHCTGLSFEESEGWVYAGYVVFEEPEIIPDGDPYIVCANGRVACRRWVNGPRKAWARTCAELTVWAITSEWAVTTRGFIRTSCIELSP